MCFVHFFGDQTNGFFNDIYFHTFCNISVCDFVWACVSPCESVVRGSAYGGCSHTEKWCLSFVHVENLSLIFRAYEIWQLCVWATFLHVRKWHPCVWAREYVYVCVYMCICINMWVHICIYTQQEKTARNDVHSTLLLLLEDSYHTHAPSLSLSLSHTHTHLTRRTHSWILSLTHTYICSSVPAVFEGFYWARMGMCVCVCACVCMNVYLCMSVRVGLCAYVRVRVCVCVCARVHLCVLIYVLLRIVMQYYWWVCLKWKVYLCAFVCVCVCARAEFKSMIVSGLLTICIYMAYIHTNI